MPRASIIILSYNDFEETTGPCLESVLANTSGDYELIVLDNASVDDAQASLKAFANRHSTVRIQCNDTNRGFAGGNNDGIMLANGEYIVLLNSDTLVPAGWLDTLLRRFSDHSEIGLIGPVTNSAGNEQRIELKGLNDRTYERIAGDYIAKQKGEWFSTEKLGFFCVAIRKEVFEKVGLLDEAFGIGMFEDDDFCLRARQAGYTLAVVEDCFVYHKGSVSFKKLSTSDYHEIFNRNRTYYFEKHGVLWTHADIASAVWKNLSEGIDRLNDKTNKPLLERVLCRISNMSDSIYQLKILEERHALASDHRLEENILKKNQKQLLELSDWATELKKDSERLYLELSEKNTLIDNFCNSFWYKLYCRFNGKRIQQ
jgi:GT2 family glycosyltransferase